MYPCVVRIANSTNQQMLGRIQRTATTVILTGVACESNKAILVFEICAQLVPVGTQVNNHKTLKSMCMSYVE